MDFASKFTLTETSSKWSRTPDFLAVGKPFQVVAFNFCPGCSPSAMFIPQMSLNDIYIYIYTIYIYDYMIYNII